MEPMNIETMVESNMVMWLTLVSFVMPLIVSTLKTSNLSKRAVTLLSMVVTGVAGVITALLVMPTVPPMSLVTIALLSAMLAMTFYKRFWKPVGVSGRLERR